MKRDPKPKMEKRPDGFYQFRFYHPNGTRPKVVLEERHSGPALKAAEAHIAKEMSEFRLGLSKAPQASIEVQEGPLLKDRIQRYLDLRYAGKKAKTTQTQVTRDLGNMLRFSPTPYRDKLTGDMADDIYLKFENTMTRKKELPSEKTKYHFLTNVCAYWDWEVEVDPNPRKNPFAHITKPKSDDFTVADEEWDQKEFEGTLKKLEHPEDQVALTVIRWSAMYPKDVFWLQEPDFQPGPSILKRRKKSTSKKQVIKLPLRRACPQIVDLVTQRLKAAKGTGKRVFCTHYPDTKDVLWVEQFGKRVQKAYEAAFPGKKPKLVKSFRHTRTTEWLKEGVEPNEVGEWLGHVKGSRMVLAIYDQRDTLRKLKQA